MYTLSLYFSVKIGAFTKQTFAINQLILCCSLSANGACISKKQIYDASQDKSKCRINVFDPSRAMYASHVDVRRLSGCGEGSEAVAIQPVGAAVLICRSEQNVDVKGPREHRTGPPLRHSETVSVMHDPRHGIPKSYGILGRSKAPNCVMLSMPAMSGDHIPPRVKFPPP